MVVLLIIAIVLLCLLLIPIGGETISENGKRQHRLIWAGMRFRISTTEHKEKRERTKDKRGMRDLLRSLSGSKDTAMDLWERLGMDLPGRIGTTLRRFYHCLHVRIHKFDFNVGFQDPAVTGIVFGAACAAASALPASIPLRLTADFIDHETKLDYRITLLIVPAQIIFEFLRAAVTLHLWEFTRFGRAIRSINHNRRQHV